MKKRTIWALTLMDEAMDWIEIVPIVGEESKYVALLVDLEWMSRYPYPRVCIHDKGTEFIGQEFQELLSGYGVESKPTTVKIPQGNAMHERVLLTMVEMLRTSRIEVEIGKKAKDEIRRVLQAVAFAIRTGVNMTTKY